MHISPHAVVGPKVEISKDVSVGAFSVLGSETDDGPDTVVKIGPGTSIASHVVIYGSVDIGCRVNIDPFCRIGPYATIGDDTQILYGARVHEHVAVGRHCIIAGNCPDRTEIGDHVIHLGRLGHGFHYPFEKDWDAPIEIGPAIGSHVAIGLNAIVIGPVTIGENTFILPGEIVRESLPGNGIWRGGEWVPMPNWSRYLRLLQPFSGMAQRTAVRSRFVSGYEHEDPV